MRSSRRAGPLVRARAWLVTGPLGRGLAFAIDFALAVRTGLAQRRR
jgi:transketolase